MTDKVTAKWKQKLGHMKKEDYIVLLLAGVLLLILSLPTEREKRTDNAKSGQEENRQEGGSITDLTESAESKEAGESGDSGAKSEKSINNNSYELDVYVDGLERRVEEILSGMEGVGKVRVMITVSDTGTEILERDRETTVNNLEETDNAGGSRKSTENGQREEVVYSRDADGSEIPYVVQRKLPEITGVVVTAQGAGNTTVKENIIGAVGVLFNLNEHRIKVIRMKS